jgi:YVTN family beta-propeller protein
MAITYAGGGSAYEAFLPPNNNALFVANRSSDSVTEMDLVSGGSPVTIGMLPGSHPVALAATVATSMWVANSGTNSACPNTGSITMIDIANLVAASTFCVGLDPVAIAEIPNGGRLYTVNAGDSTLSYHDPGTLFVGTITSANGLGANPVYALVSLDGTYLFVLTQGDQVNPGALDIINVSSNAVVGTVPLGVQPNFALLDPNLNRLYVTNRGSNNVMVFDASNVNPAANPAMPLLGTTTVGSAPVSVAALPNGTKFYTANSGSNDVTVASATSFAVLKTVPVGQDPIFVASEPSSTKIYATNFTSNSISIIQTLNDTISMTLAAPQQDPNCISSSTLTCPLQQPFMVLSK